MNEPTNVEPASATPPGRKFGSARGTAFKVAALVLTTLCLVIGAACWLHKGEKVADQTPPQGEPDAGLFYNWPKPLFAVVLSAQEHGYLLPCGCSYPQYGGLERRYNFIQLLVNGRGWPVVAYDLGDIAQKEGPAKLANVQGLIKYRYAMQALKQMNYSAVSFGEYEAALPLSDAIDEYALNEAKPAVLAANLLNKDKRFPDENRTAPEWGKSYVGSWNVTPVAGVKVSGLGIIGTHTAADVAALVAAGKVAAGAVIPAAVGEAITAGQRQIRFAADDKAIPDGLKALAVGNPDFRVLLYQGPVELAKLIPLADPDFNVILCVSEEDEPPGRPEVVTTAKGQTFIIRVGHKGKNIGVVGVFPPKKPGGPFEMQYQLVPMAPVYQTPAEKKKGHPILALMESYTKELKRDDYLSRYFKIAHGTQVTIKGNPALAALNASGYAGSAACQQCHPNAFKIWTNSKHAKAYATLVGAKDPSLREYDAECIVCHTVGFRYQDGFADAVKTPNLKDVGCESCHGPCEAHVKRPRNKDVRALINPWKAPADETPAQKTARQGRIEEMCMGCHDHDNDVTWHDDPKTGEKAFDLKWKHVKHMTPPGGEKRGKE